MSVAMSEVNILKLTSVYMFGWILKSTETPGMLSNHRSRLDHFWADSLRGSRTTPKLKIAVELSPKVKRLGKRSMTGNVVNRGID
jgi:hypothetical protein